MSARRFLISGAVQGVGFRFFTVSAARARGLTGWVRNLRDGRVEVLAEGEEDALLGLGEDLRRGPRGALVRAVEETSQAATGRFSDFDVAF